jgi:hypothetical protein
MLRALKTITMGTSYTGSRLCFGCRQRFCDFARVLAAEDLELIKMGFHRPLFLLSIFMNRVATCAYLARTHPKISAI